MLKRTELANAEPIAGAAPGEQALSRKIAPVCSGLRHFAPILQTTLPFAFFILNLNRPTKSDPVRPNPISFSAHELPTPNSATASGAQPDALFSNTLPKALSS
jgi:hypothetical protein